MKIAITGANSSVGKTLLRTVAASHDIEAIAGVRSLQALNSCFSQTTHITPAEINYADSNHMGQQFQGVDSVIHLAGILIEGPNGTYRSANVEATAAVVKAAQVAGAQHLVFISVIGADASSGNAYLRSKGLAEKLVLESGLAATVLRTPILLGHGTAGTSGILGTALQPSAKLLGGGRHTLQPLDVRDLCAVILHSCRQHLPEQGQADEQAQSQRQTVFEVVGPEAITYRELIRRVAEMKGIKIKLGSVPVWLAKLGTIIRSRVRGGGFTPTIIDVITQDEIVAHNDASTLGVKLTPLNATLHAMLKDSE
ncbi:MAG: NAD(P)H-binding protein [Pseudohongiellaceae bacterium]